jgi:ER lumen protein retaining receptor
MVKILGKGWNIFRYAADFSHVIAIIILLVKILRRKSCAGISLRTHIVYMVVFVTRYCNNEYFFPPLYNIVFKTFYLGSTALTIGLMLTKLRKTYNRKRDSFSMLLILLVPIPFAVLTAMNRQIVEILYTYSLWLEAVAIVPQLFLLQRTQRIENLTKDYIFFLGTYRLFYVLNWARKAVFKNKTPKVVWATGIIQTIIYLDFLYYYCRALFKGTEMELPR